MIAETKIKNGYTLMEVIIAMFIFGIVLIIYASAANSLILNKTAKNQELAYRIANSAVENLRATPYASLVGGPITTPLLANLSNSTAATTVSAYNSRTKLVVANVNWVEAGRSRTISVTTLITQNGVGQ